MVRALIFTSILTASFFGFESAFSKPAACIRAYAALEEKIAGYVNNPPTTPFRTLRDDEITVTRMNDWKSFQYEYMNPYNVVQYWTDGSAKGLELTFAKASGGTHTIRVIGSDIYPGMTEAVSDMVRKLPADVLEATELVEVQAFVRNHPASAYHTQKKIALQSDGINSEAFHHEFGHAVANLIWGRPSPGKEWKLAFEKDGAHFVTPYAKDRFQTTKFDEDFAEAIRFYLKDAVAFRRSSPNRAAVLDSIFRDQDLWLPIREYNGTAIAKVSRLASENPGMVATFIVVAAGGTTAIVHLNRPSK